MPLSNFQHNIAVNTDSYKASMAVQYPPGTEYVYSYIESRGGKWDRTVFFGLQSYIKEYLTVPVTQEQVDFAAKFWAAHGEPFDKVMWDYIVQELDGKLPVSIKAVPEGTVVPYKNVLCTIENTDPKCFALTTWLETSILRAIWYGTTVATQSWHIKQLIKGYLEKTGDVSGLPFKLHDFGARGVSSFESATLGDMAHLVNFMGTDTVSGILGAMEYYNSDICGFSIPASEHSTVTSWGRENEVEPYRNMLKQFGKPGALVAIVSDSYDIYNAVSNLWGGELRQEVIDSGATVIIRPDSGVPHIVVTECVRRLDVAFGHTVNDKGYKVLNHVRVIQGDGINYNSIHQILEALVTAGYSADNVAFGMGGALLQIVDRDTQAFAMKCSSIETRISYSTVLQRDVYKDPVGDSGKKSKRGRVSLYKDENGEFYSAVDAPAVSCQLKEVYRNGELLIDDTFSNIRDRSNLTL